MDLRLWIEPSPMRWYRATIVGNFISANKNAGSTCSLSTSKTVYMGLINPASASRRIPSDPSSKWIVAYAKSPRRTTL